MESNKKTDKGTNVLGILITLAVVAGGLYLIFKPKKPQALKDAGDKTPETKPTDEMAGSSIINAPIEGVNMVSADGNAEPAIKASPEKQKAQQNLAKLGKKIDDMEELKRLNYANVNEDTLKRLKNEYQMNSVKVNLMK